MILMKCPQCGRTAEAPEKAVKEGHRCYDCNVDLVFAQPEVAARRAQAKERQLRGMAIGACLGLLCVPLSGATGGVVGMAFAGGVAGATVGAIMGLLNGVIDGSWLSVLMSDRSWLGYMAITMMVIGSVLGVIGGVSGDLVAEYGRLPLLSLSGLGGLCLGGLLGASLGSTFGRNGL